jgi:hypothetical protein
MPELVGRRVQTTPEVEYPPDIRPFEPGDYMFVRTPQGTRELWFRDPVGMVGRCVSHTLTEHDDGTVTVESSIADEGEGSWHGWLRQGVWSW